MKTGGAKHASAKLVHPQPEAPGAEIITDAERAFVKEIMTNRFFFEREQSWLLSES